MLRQSWDDNQYDNVLFSNESSVTVRPKTQGKRVWRLSEQRYNPINICLSFKSESIDISIWAAFSTCGRTLLVLFAVTLNRDKYKDTLSAHVIPFSVQHYQQDNCGPHRTKSITNYMEARRMKVIKWLSQSQDLNPIENAWAMLKKKLRAIDLFDVLQAD